LAKKSVAYRSRNNPALTFATLRWLVRNRSVFGLTKTWCETVIPLNHTLYQNSCCAIVYLTPNSFFCSQLLQYCLRNMHFSYSQISSSLKFSFSFLFVEINNCLIKCFWQTLLAFSFLFSVNHVIFAPTWNFKESITLSSVILFCSFFSCN
jgi:hypothetical protein